MKWLKQMWNDERGSVFTEQGFWYTLVVIVALAGLVAIGRALHVRLNDVADKIENPENYWGP